MIWVVHENYLINVSVYAHFELYGSRINAALRERRLDDVESWWDELSFSSEDEAKKAMNKLVSALHHNGELYCD